MQQIADWLEKLGMSEYAERFAENGIDFSEQRAHATRFDQDEAQGPGHFRWAVFARYHALSQAFG